MTTIRPSFFVGLLLFLTWTRSSFLVLAQDATVNSFQASVVDQSRMFDPNPVFGKLVNARSHQKEMLVTYNGWQYVAYYDANRILSIARRQHGHGAAWERMHFADSPLSVQDSHNAPNLGICPNDGTLHIAYDHHKDDLNYRRSVIGLLDDPTAFVWAASVFSSETNMLDPADGVLDFVTYPMFITAGDGNMHMTYRKYTSGNGDQQFVDYNGQTGTWSNNRKFIGRAGSPHVDPWAGTSTFRNAYINNIDYDDQGTLHCTFTFRENSTPNRYNRNIYYAFSEDQGQTWLNQAGDVVASSDQGTFITTDSPGVVAVDLDASWGLMNNQGHVVDSRGRVHVVMYHKLEQDTVDVSFGGSNDNRYFHYWSGADGVWHKVQLDHSGGRPKLLADAHGNLFLCHISAGKLSVDKATPESNYTDWVSLGTWFSGLQSDVQVDFSAFKAHSMLSVAVQEAGPSGATVFVGVIDLHITYNTTNCHLIDQPCTSQTTHAVERDLYVRNGASSNMQYGTESELQVMSSNNPDSERRAFLRFNLADLQNVGPIQDAKLRLSVAGSGISTNWFMGTLALRRCAMDTWPEATTSWSNSPVANGPTYFSEGGGSFLEFDVVEVISNEMAVGGSRITFEIKGVDDDMLAVLHSREAGGTLAPRLVVTQKNSVVASDDVYVRGGVHEDGNFGTSYSLTVKESYNEDYARLSYIRFDVSQLNHLGTVERAFLEVKGSGMGPLGATTPFVIHKVTNDNWSAADMTWATKPALDGAIDSQFGRKGSMRFDVTQALMEAVAGDGQLSFGLRGDREGAQRALNLYSSRAASEANCPTLLLRYANHGA